MGTIENEFIKKLEAFLDTEFSPVCHRKINGLLKEYRLSVPPVFIKPKMEVKNEESLFTTLKVDRNIQIDSIVSESCNFLGVDEKTLLGKSRKRYLAEKRHMVATYLVNVKGCRLIDVGRRFNRDHTTIINSNVIVKELCETDMDFRTQYEKLTIHLNTIL